MINIEIREGTPEQVTKILDVSTAACTNCGKPARVPEDVVAVLENRETGEAIPLVVCPLCVPEWVALWEWASEGE